MGLKQHLDIYKKKVSPKLLAICALSFPCCLPMDRKLDKLLIHENQLSVIKQHWLLILAARVDPEPMLPLHQLDSHQEKRLRQREVLTF